jgi:hypothetical protein
VALYLFKISQSKVRVNSGGTTFPPKVWSYTYGMFSGLLCRDHGEGVPKGVPKFRLAAHAGIPSSSLALSGRHYSDSLKLNLKYSIAVN